MMNKSEEGHELDYCTQPELTDVQKEVSLDSLPRTSRHTNLL